MELEVDDHDVLAVFLIVDGQVPLSQATLLDKHVQQKRLRADVDQERIKPASQITRGRQTGPSLTLTVPPVIPASPPADEVQVPAVDFSQFNNTQLTHLLWDVGVNTAPLNRDALISQCQAYNDLIIVPAEFLSEVPVTNPSTPFDDSSTFTVQVPVSGSQLHPSTEPTLTSQSATSIESSGPIEDSDSSDLITEEAQVVQTNSEVPRPMQPTSKVLSSSVTSTQPTNLQADSASLEPIPRVSSRRTSCASITKATVGSDSSPALVQGPSSKKSIKASKARQPSCTGTSGRHDASKIRPKESTSTLSLDPNISQKGKGREGVSSMDLETCSTVKDMSSGDSVVRTRASIKSSTKKDNSSTTNSPSATPSQNLSDSRSTSKLSAPIIPSLEHGRLSYPRPNPTIRKLSSNLSKQKSNKQQPDDDKESEWELNSISDGQSDMSSNRYSNRHHRQKVSHRLNPASLANSPAPSERPGRSSTHAKPGPTTSGTAAHITVDESIQAEEWTLSDLKRKVAEDSVLIQRLQLETNELNEKVESLTADLRYLSKTVSSLKMDQGDSPKKTRGGCTASNSHFDVL
ncbi:uncharacterized protein MELLADRAFT_69831 [Melampsora larici-populina 98AG31]|uniref:Uncharacterized protein n=1 Tax=Melampsora larici-populina (strain 98AG31 / pathotype 3-4-7) TaxID=747676 RepID=F4SCD6_MELLP|nr:uncharacterized protein MELLADRAFT_69831 [Melampsora larici-populina 98AG31]EGF97694.1 hypothetical protein MELLADRAFT_69831 [Melampsora larici-populina 98AG31]